MKVSWFKGVRPVDMPVKQIYGIVFDRHGRVLVQNDAGRYNLPGGKPEGNETPNETLRRECLEESQIIIEDIRYLGYCRVEDDSEGNRPYAQLRCIARLAAVRKNAPDPSTRRAYGRELLPPEDAITRLGWGAHGKRQISAAVEAAFKEFGLRPVLKQREVISDEGTWAG